MNNLVSRGDDVSRAELNVEGHREVFVRLGDSEIIRMVMVHKIFAEKLTIASK